MRAVVQRVAWAKVEVDGEIIGEIEKGLLVYLGVGKGDGDTASNYILGKVLGLRIFEDDQGKMNHGVVDVGGKLLVVSQFTLYGDSRKGRRPSWTAAAPGPVAAPLVAGVVDALRARGLEVATGTFGADMAVSMVNDGPVTLIIDA